MSVRQMSLEFDVAKSRGNNDRNAYIAKALMEDSRGNERLMDSICERQNMLNALKRVESNNGAPGVDGMKCSQL